MRTTKTGSGNIAVQVVLAKSKKTILIKHVGSASNEKELGELKQLAIEYIASQKDFPPLSPDLFTGGKPKHHVIDVENIAVVKTFHNFAYEVLTSWYKENGFNKLGSEILKDLVIGRIIEPTSKLQTISLLGRYFNIKYPKNKIYSYLYDIAKLKSKTERLAFNYVSRNLSDSFTLVFYDVTTLYFETSNPDRLRKYGFSKDGKANQPQILIGLMVNRDGYPISFNTFPGNVFEGKTFIPSILKLQKKHSIKDLTIVADSAMLSGENMKDLEGKGLGYIVGARVSNLPTTQIASISKNLGKKEGRFFQLETEKGTLICDYSKKRAAKDRDDRKKQLLKAQHQITNPSKVTKRSRFIKQTRKLLFSLNEDLIKKDEMLDGIKGYYTNLKNVHPSLIISRYHDLWQVEKSFRIAKSDLLARPIFHYKETSIKAHVLIVFISLCITKSIELKTKISIKKVKEIIWEVEDIKFKDKLTDRVFIKRMEIQNPEVKNLFP